MPLWLPPIAECREDPVTTPQARHCTFRMRWNIREKEYLKVSKEGAYIYHWSNIQENGVEFDTFAEHFLLIPANPAHQLSLPTPSPPSPYISVHDSHCSFAISPLPFANFLLVSLPLSFPPCIPQRRALNLALCLWAQRSVTGQMVWSLAGEMLWGAERGLTGGLCPDLLSAQKMGESAAPWMPPHLNWQCRPVLTLWSISPSTQAALTESMAYDSEITGLDLCCSIGILSSLSISQYKSQLGPLSVHFINKHDCPEAHAQLFIMQVSQGQRFVTGLNWNFWGGAHCGEIYLLRVWLRAHWKGYNLGSTN